MKEELYALEKLQRLDLELESLNERLQTYPKRMNQWRAELDELECSLEAWRDELKQRMAEKSLKEMELMENEGEIKKAEERLFVIKTHKEYEALEKELAEAKRLGKAIENDILKALEAIEQLEAKISESEKELEKKRLELGEKIEQTTTELESARSEYEKKLEEKKRVASSIGPDVLALYEKIKSRNGVAVVAVKGEVCQGCYMNVPPQLYNEVVSMHKLIQCPNCQRILFYHTEEEKVATA